MRRPPAPAAAHRPQGSPGAVPRPSSALDGRAGALTAPDSALGWVGGPGGCGHVWVVYAPPARLGWVAAVHTPPGATWGHWGGMGRVSGRSGAFMAK